LTTARREPLALYQAVAVLKERKKDFEEGAFSLGGRGLRHSRP